MTVKNHADRRMPTIMHADPTDTTPDAERVLIPSLPRDQWHERLRAFVGRDLTDEETVRVKKLARLNWTLCVVAEDILGRDLTDADYARYDAVR